MIIKLTENYEKVHSSNDYETEGEWKIQLSMQINLVSSKDSDEICIVHAKSDNIDILMSSEMNEEEFFKSLLQKYQEGLEESIRRSEFVFDSVNLLYYHFQKISLKRGRSYTDSPKWPKNKKTINRKNNDGNCFQYALTVALNYHNIRKRPSKNIKIYAFY